MRMLNVLSSRLAWILEEVSTIVSTPDLSFVHNLLEGDKMELVFELTHNMFKFASIFFLTLLFGETSWS